MFKCLLSLPLAVGLAPAAIVSTSVTCNDVTTIGTTSASCNDVGRSNASASSPNPFPFGGIVGIVAQAVAESFPPGSPPNSAEAHASFSEDYVFTVFGGTGGGFFRPCFSSHGTGATGPGVASFDGFGSPSDPPFSVCVGPSGPFPSPGAFTFGVSQIVPFTAGVSVILPPLPPQNDFRQQGEFDVQLIGFEFFDPAGNQLLNATFTLVAVPEPSSWLLLGVGLLCLLAVPPLVRSRPPRRLG
jgi:hypothetical protein